MTTSLKAVCLVSIAASAGLLASSFLGQPAAWSQGAPAAANAAGQPLDPLAQALTAYSPAAQEAVRATIRRYGTPDFVSGRLIEWDDRGPFTRIIAYSHPVRHLFPEPHDDILFEEIKMVVPPERAAELMRFDGSLSVERTRGTLAAWESSEATGLLALNLAQQIIAGKLDHVAARRKLAEGWEATAAGKQVPGASRLLFSPAFETADPDAPAPARR